MEGQHIVHTLKETLSYYRRGLRVIPVKFREKAPALGEWQKAMLDENGIRTQFEGIPRNVGVVLGEASGDLVDVEDDCEEAVKLGDRLLPQTSAVFGRESKPNSHRLYYAPGASSIKFKGTDGKVLAELRSNGCQTVFPPSVHPSGEQVRWGGDGGMSEPARVEAKDLERACRERATAALVARHLPEGGRHDFAMALAGFLLRPGRLDREHALRIMEAAWDVAGYPGGKSRAEAMRDLESILHDTVDRLEVGQQVWGGPTLDETSPGLPDALKKIWGWTKGESLPAGRPNPVSAAELLAREFPPINWVVPGVLPEGVTLLAGKPKIGKSWLGLDLCLGVAQRGIVLGTKKVEKGSALYLALEDNPRRLQRRLKKLVNSGVGEHAVPQGFDIATQWPRVGDGAEEALHEWLKGHPDARLIVVDTLKKIRPRTNANRSLYDLDYEALEPLLPLAAEFGVGLVVVHHTRKLPGADVLDEISGSTGLSGGVDGALVLRRERGKHDATLFVTGRDVEEEAELALHWDTSLARWVVMGDAQEYRISEERRAVLEVLKKAGKPLQPHEISSALDKGESAVRRLLPKMALDGEIRKIGESPKTRYALPDDYPTGHTDHTSHSTHGDHTSHNPGPAGTEEGQDGDVEKQDVTEAEEGVEEAENGTVTGVTSVTDDRGDHSAGHPPEQSPTTVVKPDDVPALLEEVRSAEVIGLDLETTGLDPRQNQARIMSLATEKGVWVVDLFDTDPTPILEALKEKTLVIHNAAFDLGFLHQLGYEHEGEVIDTMLLSQLLYAGANVPPGKGRTSHALDAVVERELGEALDKEHQRADWADELTPEMIEYAAKDARVLIPLHQKLIQKVEEAGLSDTLVIEQRAQPAILWMSRSGLPFDKDRWLQIAQEAKEEAAHLNERLQEMAPPHPEGKAWNWNSHQQIKRVLSMLGLEVENTQDETLARIDHDFVHLLREYKRRAVPPAAMGRNGCVARMVPIG